MWILTSTFAGETIYWMGDYWSESPTNAKKFKFLIHAKEEIYQNGLANCTPLKLGAK